ncbi:DUF5703 domain-containing protein [Niabella ginsenosidivorans]|nr:DUF5703 domain-containing protein [Niabella ginsenosidivorans]
MKRLLKFLGMFFCCLPAGLHAQQVSDYNVVWNMPSQNSAGSMPLGNGELGMNVWVEEGGDLLFYLSRTDAISEANRLMKLGRVRVHLSPNPFKQGKPFVQTLLLNEGVIEIKAGDATIRLFMDASNNVAYITFDSKQKREITVTAESWRKVPHIITAEESFSAWTTNPLPPALKLEESADTFLPAKNIVEWCHANKGSQLYDLTVRHQNLLAQKQNFPDLISNRVFGVAMSGKAFVKSNDSTLSSKVALIKAMLKITAHSSQVKSVDEWKKQIAAIAGQSSLTAALDNSKKWWGAFWNKSYVYINIPGDKAFGYKLTQSYILQRYMAACSGRGNFPVKFNGSIFTTEPQYTNAAYPLSSDYRNWGNDFWWQNTRLPYYAMFASGDFNLMQSFFKFYLDRTDAFKTMAQKFYDAEGLFIPETISVFGTYSNGDYGWDRTGVTPKDVTNEYIRFIWVQSLELSKMMLDYYAYTNDTAFLQGKALPFIKQALLYFNSRFVADRNKMRITPTQSIETYWYNVVNDLPCVAGLHCVLNALKDLPGNLMEKNDKAFFDTLIKTLPPVPQKATVEGNIFIPAEEYLNVACNVENPELYAVFPFGVSNFSNDLKETGIRTYKHRVNNLNKGWGQDGQIAAILGLTDSLPAMLKEKIANTNSNYRFPAMWGPNYDWTPDQDHGSNLLLTIQYMLLQTYKGKNYLLPAFPKNWNVSFRLYAPGYTIINADYRQGKLSYREQISVLKQTE